MTGRLKAAPPARRFNRHPTRSEIELPPGLCLMKGNPLLLLPLVCAALGAAEPQSDARIVSLPPAEAKAFELEVLHKVADLALVPPRLNTSPLPEYDYDQLDYGMTIGITRTPKGRIWAAWVAGGDSPMAFMVAATSDDDGETWSKPRLVINSQAKHLPIPRS